MRMLPAALAIALAGWTLGIPPPAQAATEFTATGGEKVTFAEIEDQGQWARTTVLVACANTVDDSALVMAELHQGTYQDYDSGERVPCNTSEPVPVEFTFWNGSPATYRSGPGTLTVRFAASSENGLYGHEIDLPTTISVPVPPPPPITKPGTPWGVSTTRASRQVRLHWYLPEIPGNPRIDRYQVQRGNTASTRRNVAPTAGETTPQSALFTGLVNGRRYAFYVRAHNRVGYSPWALAYGTPKAPPRPRAYRSCAAMQSGMWPHGVGRAGASDKTSGTPVTTFAVSTTGYRMNDGWVVRLRQYDLDRDNDGIACERR